MDWYLRHREQLQEGVKHCWPGEWAADEASAAAYFAAEGTKVYVIDSSLGLSGWVLALQCETSPTAARLPSPSRGSSVWNRLGRKTRCFASTECLESP